MCKEAYCVSTYKKCTQSLIYDISKHLHFLQKLL